ncbi:DUF2066 domain-containing protein [Glaciecola sp. 2405UD65-10]|uniref:DUF2066 domain-containing protein n=1 Tax=Glaciecola sp. 2405UD65-10 TaxID=3397244 RepID=UPI003B5C7F75
MNQLTHLLLFITLLFSGASSVCARNIDHVNVGRVPVVGQSIYAQQEAGKEALAQVFVKLSGTPTVLNEPAIKRAVDNYEQFLIASSFLQKEDNLIFEATFNRQKVENLLMASGLNVWASLRPTGIVWLANKDLNKRKNVLYQNQASVQKDASALISTIELKAFARGIDLIIPIGDLQDTSNVSVYDVWNQFVSVLRANSIRYNADFLLSATIESYNQNDHALALEQQKALKEEFDAVSEFNQGLRNISNAASDNQDESEANLPTNSELEQLSHPTDSLSLPNAISPDTQFKIDYIFTDGKTVETGTLFSASQELGLSALVDEYANVLAKQFAVNQSSDTSITEAIEVVFNNVDSLSDYVSVINLLESLPSVSKVYLNKQESKKSYFLIEQSISAQQLKSILSLDPRLQTESSVSNDQTMQFYWRE